MGMGLYSQPHNACSPARCDRVSLSGVQLECFRCQSAPSRLPQYETRGIMAVMYVTGYFATRSDGVVLTQCGATASCAPDSSLRRLPYGHGLAPRRNRGDASARVRTVPAGIAWCAAAWLRVGSGGTRYTVCGCGHVLWVGIRPRWPTIHGIPVSDIPRRVGSAVAQSNGAARVGAFGVALASH